MNKIYRMIWSEINRAWVAVSEITKGCGKTNSGVVSAFGIIGQSSGFVLKPLALAMATIGMAYAGAPATNQLPTGGQLVAGSASIAQNGTTMNVNQSSTSAAINWQTFNIGSAATVNFNQPSSSSVALNRVLDSNPSQIYGHLNANGQVFFTNPNGMYFAPSASVDVGGLVATTHSISDADFMAGNYVFNRNGATGSIVNDGNLTALLGGYIALLAPSVQNNGVIVAQMGTVALASGENYTLQLTGSNTLADIAVTPATIAALVQNGNAVQAPGGLIILSAQAADRLQGGVIKNSGALEATGLVNNGGVIRLSASDTISQTGSINADAAPNSSENGGTVSLIANLANAGSTTIIDGSISARGGNLGGNGGSVETSGGRVQVGNNASVDTLAPLGKSGSWLLDPNDFTIASSGGDITGAALSTALGSGNVTIQTTATTASCPGATCTTGTGGSGNILVQDSIAKTSGGDATLTLQAYESIIVSPSVSISSTSGKLNTILWANNGGNSSGSIWIKSATTILTNGGAVWMGGGSGTASFSGLTVGNDYAVGDATDSNGVQIDGLTLTTAGGNIAIYGKSRAGAPAGGGSVGGNNADGVWITVAGTTTINSGTGTILINGVSQGTGGGGQEGIGVELYGNSQSVTSAATSGNAVTIVGVGSSGGSNSYSDGIYLHANESISATGGGNISLTGTGGTSGENYGMNFSSSTSTASAGAGNLTLIGDTMNLSGTFSGTGTLTIQPLTASTSIGIAGGAGTLALTAANFSTNFVNGFSGITVGNNTAGTITIAGSTTYNNPLTFETASDLIMSSGSSLTGNANLTFWANAGNTGGAIWLQGTGSAGASINTNGGNITLSGGTNVATGYAQGDSTNSNGVTLDTSTLNSGGGNIVIRGKGAATAVTYATSEGTGNNNDGIRLYSGNTINSGTGTIDIEGVAVGTGSGASNGIETNIAGYTQILSTATNTTAITLFGDASGGTNSGNAWGTFLWGGNTFGIVIAATGTGGGISLNGKGDNSATGAGGTHLEPNAFVLAASGPISITGTAGTSSTYADVDINGTVGFVGSLTGFGISSPVTASSSNISIAADTLSADHVFGSGTFSGSAVQSSGALTIAPRTTGKAMAVQTTAPAAGTDWINPASMFGSSGLFKTGFSTLVFGSSTTGNVTLDNYTFDNPTVLDTSGNAVLGAVSIANNSLTVNMTGSGSITETGTVAVSKLDLNGNTSAATLNGTTNAIGTLAANVASLSLVDSSALTIGTVGSMNGVTTTGTINISTMTGNLIVSQNVATSNTSSSALVLDAGTSDLVGTTYDNIVLSGSPTVTVGSGGCAMLYTGSITNSTGVTALVGSGSGDFRYDSKVGTNNFTAALGTSGTFAVYREQPTFTVTPGTATSIYGNAVSVAGVTGTVATGYVNGDSTSTTSGTATFTTTATSSSHVGIYNIAYASGLTNSLGYGYADATGSTGEYSVTVRTLTPTLSNVGVTKVYDGTTAAPTGFTPTYTFSGLASGDTAATLTDTSATYNSTHVASATQVTVSGLAISGITGNGVASDYVLSSSSKNVTASITPATLTPTITNAGVTKTYDGTTYAPVGFAPTYSITGYATGDSAATLTNTGSAYNSAHVASATQVIVSGLAISGINGNGLTSDYVLDASSKNVSAGITKAALTVTANADAKIVTQTDTAGYNGVNYTGLVGGETSSVLGGTLAIARSNTGTEGAGTYTGVLVPTGYTSSDYNISYANGNYTIVPANQLLIKVANVSSAYGTAPTYTISSAQYMNGSNVISTLTQSAVNGNTYTYTDNAGGSVTFMVAPTGASTSTSNNVNVGNYAITGSNTSIVGNNFTALTFIGNQTVTQQSLTASASNVSKVYDGTTTMTGVTLGLTGLVTNDLVTVSGAGAFASNNAGSNLSYTLSNIALSGNDASNYYLTGGNSFSGANGVITQAPLTVTASNATKTYGQTPTLTGFTSSGLVNGETIDSVTETSSGTVATANVSGSPYTITPSAATGGTFSTGNYNITYANGSLTITPATLTVTANNASKANNGIAYSFGNGVVYAGFVNNENNTVLSGSLTYAGSSQGAINAGNYVITPQGLTSSNYQISFVDGTLTISPAAQPVILPPAQPIILPPASAPIQAEPTVPSTTQPDMAPPDVTPIQMPGSVVTQNTSSVATQDVGDKGISISLTRLPSEQQTGIIAVSVPKEMATAGSGFSFPLPAQVANTAAGSSNTTILVTTISGQPLPSWLTFNPETKTFVATAVPDGAFPMQVAVNVNGVRSIIVISERTQ